MSTDKPVRISREGGVGVIELARPDKFNCLSLAVHAAIAEALDEFEAPGSGVRAVLVRAQGKHFCTGADLDEVKRLRSRPADIEHFIRYGHVVLQRLEASSLPVVAACQGLALAGGSDGQFFTVSSIGQTIGQHDCSIFSLSQLTGSCLNRLGITTNQSRHGFRTVILESRLEFVKTFKAISLCQAFINNDMTECI